MVDQTPPCNPSFSFSPASPPSLSYIVVAHVGEPPDVAESDGETERGEEELAVVAPLLALRLRRRQVRQLHVLQVRHHGARPAGPAAVLGRLRQVALLHRRERWSLLLLPSLLLVGALLRSAKSRGQRIIERRQRIKGGSRERSICVASALSCDRAVTEGEDERQRQGTNVEG